MLKSLRILVVCIKGICVHYFLPVCFTSQNIVIFPMISQAVSGRTKKDLLPLIHLDRKILPLSSPFDAEHWWKKKTSEKRVKFFILEHQSLKVVNTTGKPKHQTICSVILCEAGSTVLQLKLKPCKSRSWRWIFSTLRPPFDSFFLSHWFSLAYGNIVSFPEGFCLSVFKVWKCFVKYMIHMDSDGIFLTVLFIRRKSMSWNRVKFSTSANLLLYRPIGIDIYICYIYRLSDCKLPTPVFFCCI